jgi:ribosomal protein S18 acetylase RimI-like enzyme
MHMSTRYQILESLHKRRKIKSSKRIGYVLRGLDEKTVYNPLFENKTDFSMIREVTYEDVLSKHFTDWFFEMEDFADYTLDTFDFYEITHGEYGNMVYGYFHDNNLDGIIRVNEILDDTEVYELSFLFVNKAVQEQGIGQCLFSSVVDWFNDKDLILYVYTDNDNAIHIYKKYGFEITGVGYDKGYKDDNPHYIMKRKAKKYKN